MIETGCEAEPAVVLGEGLLLVPLNMLESVCCEELTVKYQFAAIMGFARIFFLDLGFCRRFGNEDLFFFFWSSRPIFSVYDVVWR